jgi:glutathione S-transferase
MTIEAAQFVLRTTLTSPFGRKVRMAADVLGISDRIAIQHADTYDEGDTLHAQNPLGKIPCLVLPDGASIFDSGVILEFLQDIAHSEKLLPRQGSARFSMLTQTRLADGIIDAGALVLYEKRYHERERASRPYIDHQRGKMRRALAAFEAAVPDAAKTDAVTITLACALGFLDKRKPLDWRSACPNLVAWFAEFAANEPAFDRTSAPPA